MTTTRTDATAPDLATQFDIAALLAGATKDTEPEVKIPAPIAAFLDGEVPAFRSHTNRFRRTLNINSDALAKGILAYRKADLKLTGHDLHVAAAKEFCRQVRQYAKNNRLSPATTRDDNVVVYRLARPKADKPAAAPVTVTQVPEPAAAK